MGTVNMCSVYMDMDGNTMKDAFGLDPNSTEFASDLEKCRELTLGRVCYHALLANYVDEQNLTWETKWARGDLAQRIRDNTEAILSSEEVTLLKNLIGRMYNVAIITWALPILEPDCKPGKIA